MTVIVNKRVIATLKFPSTIPELIAFLRGIIFKLTGNIYVPVPYPAGITTLVNLNANVNILESAQTAVLTRVTGSKAARDAARDVCKKDFRSIRGMVQQNADNNTSATITDTLIIETAGLGVKVANGTKPRVFSAKNTPVAGTIKIVAGAIPKSKGSHLWYLTTDTVGFTGKVILPPTTKAATTVIGLIPVTKYALFHTAVVPSGINIEEGPIFLTVS